MMAAPAPGAEPARGRPPFTDASPAQVRAALIPEDVTEFDRQWRAAMATATETLDLTGVHRTLECWRRIAWRTTSNGPDAYQRMLARAEETLRTGELPPGHLLDLRDPGRADPAAAGHAGSSGRPGDARRDVCGRRLGGVVADRVPAVGRSM